MREACPDVFSYLIPNYFFINQSRETSEDFKHVKCREKIALVRGVYQDEPGIDNQEAAGRSGSGELLGHAGRSTGNSFW